MEQEFINLFDLFNPDRLRTVSNFREMLKCPRDITVQIELKATECAKLPFKTPWDGIFFAYYLSDEKNQPDKWFINDWGENKCQIILERGKKQISSHFVKTEDVLRLLMECRRILAQR